MTKRYYIYVGDATTADGVVKEGLPGNTWDGRATAHEGDEIDCRSCESTGTIECSGTRLSRKGVHGKEAALDGDLCICKCKPHPRLKASQSRAWTEGEAAPTTMDFGNAEKNAAIGPTGSQYDQHFVILDSASRQPVDSVAYAIESVSGEHYDSVDTDGKTIETYFSSEQDVRLKYALQTQWGVDKK
ncbi:PAAR domain-containing protein [Glaciimonas sp. GG7]